ncbi:hypothetical protein ACWDKQ_33630 [Saccharopolyspora sp. NPDC000995]
MSRGRPAGMGGYPLTMRVRDELASIDEDIAIQQVELVESVVRQQATLFSDDLTFLATPASSA